MLAFWLVASVPLAARAHGGEDHGPPRTQASASAQEHTASSETELFTVVVKYPVRGQGGRLPVRLYVADTATSAPVEGARVRLEVQGIADVQPLAREPGVYEAAIPEPPAGQHADAVVTIEAQQVDILTLSALHFGAVEAAAPSDPHASPSVVASGPGLALAGVGALSALVLGAIGVRVLRRRRTEPAPEEVQG
jgi:hypothetical protein